ncbi:chromosome partitioning protein ParA [Vibrio sp. RE86]|uniref:chromosome partitioning protein ParA n=1 Tax=Vibrio sp. RE86 TaxID=2607605 RepID=UPI0014933422|nr:chromosome partitioning protein ParA [Vibrio sp. RE86]NOH79239.1 chromosome partitioning protein ParA [Vibrio sp. RE86]
MVSINGLPPSLPGPNKTNKTKKNEVKKTEGKTPVGQPSKVANAVAHSIRHVNESDIHKAQVQYDLPPEGRGRKAMEEYLQVMTQAKRDELSQMMGVDIYI